MSLLKRFFCVLLAIMLCMTLLVACAPPTEPTNPTVSDSQESDKRSSESETTDTSDTEDPKTLTGLQDTYDFGGMQEFTILSRSETSYEFESVAGLSGTAVEAAIYSRNEEVMERCNVEITVVPFLGDWDNRDGFMSLVRNDAQLPVSEYDLVGTHSPYLMVLAVEGLGWNFADLPNLDLTKRWWSEAFYNSCNYNGAQYIAFGDITYTLYSYMMVTFFNSQMAEDLEIEDLYDVALAGDWTYSKMEECVKKVTTNMDAAEDDRQYGMLTNAHATRVMLSAFNIDLVSDGADGKHEVKILMPATIQEPGQLIVDFVLETAQVYYNNDIDSGVAVQNPMFSAGRALFYQQMLGEALYFKGEMKQDYGVLPLPKYNGDQKEYRTGYRDDMTAIMVPFNCSNEEMSGTVTEMLCEISYKDVTQEYYEETLKYQAFNDPKCVASLELIRNTFNPTFACVYSYSLGTINSMVSNTINGGLSSGTAEINSYYLNKSGTWRQYLRDLYEDLDAIAAARSAS